VRKAAGLIGSAAIAGLVAGVLLDVVAFLLVPVLFKPAAIDVSSAMTFFILGWMVAAPMLAVTPAYESYRSPHPAGLLRMRADLATGWGGVQLPAPEAPAQSSRWPFSWRSSPRAWSGARLLISTIR